MQSVIQVTCYRGGSLREAVANDKRLQKYNLAVSRQKTPGRIIGHFIAYLMRRHRSKIRSILLLPG
jgi:hypothetical protein